MLRQYGLSTVLSKTCFLIITIIISAYCNLCCFSCIQALPPVNDSARNAACIFYNYTAEDGLCKNVITSLYIFGNNDTLAHGEKQTLRFQRFFNMTIAKISEKCKPIMIDLFCRYHFPPCDTSLDKPYARGICRKTCEYMDQDLCKEEMVHVRQAAEAAPVVDKDMINCLLYSSANGGDAPECYEYYSLPGECISIIVYVTSARFSL